MRMRTLPEAVKAILQDDPESAVTLTALRRMVKQGKIPFVEMGTKRLIDVDCLPEYLAGHTAEPPHGLVQRIPE